MCQFTEIMKVAVLGASGYIGSRFVEMLHLSELAEVCLVVGRFSSLAGVARFDLDWRIADALDEEALAKAFDTCEAV